MTKYILFDVDWVLIKSAGKFSEYFEKDQWLEPWAMQGFFRWVFRECSIWKSDLKQEISRFFDEWNYKWTSKEILDLWFSKDWVVDFEIVDLIKYLRNSWYKCYIATNQEKYRADYLLKNLWFNDLVDWKYISCHLWVSKPELDFYRYIIADLWVKPIDLILIDDQEKNLLPASSLWINTILYKDIKNLKINLQKYI